MASAKAKIRHVFGDTFSCRAAPPDILVKLSGRDVHGGLQFGFKDGGQVIVPVVLEFTAVISLFVPPNLSLSKQKWRLIEGLST